MADPTVVPVPAPTPTPVRGWLTTEFYVTLAGSLIAILNSAFNWHIPTETILTVVGGLAAYVLSRGLAKKPAATVMPVVTP